MGPGATAGEHQLLPLAPCVNAGHGEYFAFGPLLDGYVITAGTAPVNGGFRQRRVERHTVGAGRQRLEIGADLVADIAVGGGAIAAHQHTVHSAATQQLATAVVRHQGAGHTRPLQLPGRQVHALVARPGFGNPDVHRDTRGMRLVDRRQRRTPLHGCQPAGVTVSHDVQWAGRLYCPQ